MTETSLWCHPPPLLGQCIQPLRNSSSIFISPTPPHTSSAILTKGMQQQKRGSRSRSILQLPLQKDCLGGRKRAEHARGRATKTQTLTRSNTGFSLLSFKKQCERASEGTLTHVCFCDRGVAVRPIYPRSQANEATSGNCSAPRAAPPARGIVWIAGMGGSTGSN